MLVNTEAKVVTIDLFTGMVELEKEDIAIYPNPARDKLYINTGGIFKMDGYQLRIINQTGVTVFETRMNESQNEIDLSDWKERGLYFAAAGRFRGTCTGNAKNYPSIAIIDSYCKVLPASRQYLAINYPQPVISIPFNFTLLSDSI